MVLRIALPNLLIVVECHSCTPLSNAISAFPPFHASNAVSTCLNPADLSVEIEGFYFSMLRRILLFFLTTFLKLSLNIQTNMGTLGILL